MHMARVCTTGFGATIAAVFVLIYQLREFPLSVVTTNRFELRFELKQLLRLYYKICPCYKSMQYGDLNKIRPSSVFFLA